MEELKLNLNYLQKEITLLANVVKPVLNTEIVVYDKNKKVIASTGGGNHAKVGQKVRGHIISEVITSKRPLHNLRPGFHEICKSCVLYKNCPEKADISFPLLYKDEPVGVISLTAYSKEQELEFKKKYNILSKYLDSLAHFISNNIILKNLFEKHVLETHALSTIINKVNIGVMIINNNGKVVSMNNTCNEFFNTVNQQVLGRDVRYIIPDFPIEDISAETNKSNRHLSVTIEGKNTKLTGEIYPLVNKENTLGAVFTFNKRELYPSNIVTKLHYYKNYDEIISKSEQLLSIKEKAERIADSSSTVLILGESGTGKELFARLIHEKSSRKKQPFKTINCAAIPEQLLESELFGYTGGSFTGATKKGKPGKFEMADGGTIFLDEIGDMPLHLQAKILRVLEERKVERLGGSQLIPVDVRIIAATNRDLEEMVAKQEFREDLFYRLNVVPLYIPPLRERDGDIAILLDFFLKRYSKKLNKPVNGFTEEAKQLLLQYSWPGNVRELKNTVEYAVHMTNTDWIDVTDIPERITNNAKRDLKENDILPLSVVEERMIKKALEKFGTTGEGKRKAANALGINLATLYRKINHLDLL